MLLATGLPLVVDRPAAAQKALFLAKEVPQERFILVAAPIGSGERAQLNIYEQLNDRRPCFSTSGADPVIVNPLLGTFDFTGICNRFIDANGFSLRIGETDLAVSYRLSVVREKRDTVLLAIPLKANVGPELLVARTHGTAPGFLQLRFEPGWTLKRRHFGPRPLGHVYIHREASLDTAATPQPGAAPAAQTAPTSAPAAAASPAPTTTRPVQGAATRPVAAPAAQTAPTTPAKAPASAVPAATAPATQPRPVASRTLPLPPVVVTRPVTPQPPAVPPVPGLPR